MPGTTNYELISLCWHSAAPQISADTQWNRRHVISEKNCADFDSRLTDKGAVRAGEVLGAGLTRRRLATSGIVDAVGLSRRCVDRAPQREAAAEKTEVADSRPRDEKIFEMPSRLPTRAGAEGPTCAASSLNCSGVVVASPPTVLRAA